MRRDGGAHGPAHAFGNAVGIAPARRVGGVVGDLGHRFSLRVELGNAGQFDVRVSGAHLFGNRGLMSAVPPKAAKYYIAEKETRPPTEAASIRRASSASGHPAGPRCNRSGISRTYRQSSAPRCTPDWLAKL